MQATSFRGLSVIQGDVPILPLTEQSILENRLLTDESKHSKYQVTFHINDTAQSYQSFRPKFNENQDTNNEPKNLDRVLSPSDITKFSEKLFNNLFNEFPKNARQSKDCLLSQENIEKFIKPQIPGFSPKQVSNRLNAEFQTLQDKKQQNQMLQEIQQLSKCTFKPQLSVKTQQLSGQTKPKAQSPPRYMSPRQTRSPNISKVQAASTTTVVNKKRNSKEDKENNQSSGFIDRLSKPKNSPTHFNSPPQESFRPAIRPQSPVSSTQRTQKLYEDAFKTKQPKEYYFKPPSKDNTKSKKFQVDHFIKEFYKQITQAREWTLQNIEEHRRKSSFDYDVEGDLCLMTLDELVFVLNGLGFMPVSSYDPIDPENKAIKLFKSLQCPQGLGIILTRNLLVFLLATQGLGDQIMQIPHYLNSYSIEFPKHFQSGLFEFEDGNLVILDIKQVQKQYAYLYNSYLSYYKKPIVQQQPLECAPTERCNQKTQQLANSFRQRLKSFVSSKNKLNLNDFQEIYRQKKILKQESEVQKQLSECTFKPNINVKHNTQHNSFNQLSQPKQKKDKSTNLILYEQQKEQCTFTPDISRSQSSHNFSIQPIANQVKDSKVVQRLVQGRVGKKAKELALQMGCSLNKTKRVALEHIAIQEEISRYTRSRHISSISASSQVPPSSQQPCPSPQPSPQPSSTIQPNLFIDVNLEDNQVDRIIVYDSSDAKDLAVQFASKHNLDENTIKRLTKIIEEQIASTK